MLKEKKKSPILRFPEFKEFWDKVKLADHLIEYKKRVPASTEIPILTSSRKGLYLQKNYFDNREVQNEGEYGVVPKGYFTYRHMSDDSTFKFNINEKYEKGAVSKEYPVFTTKGMNSYFLKQILNNGIEFKKFAIIQKKGGTRTRLYFNKLKEFRPTIPSLPEQTKIANFLTAIDTRLQQLRKKKNLLEQYKKGVMQQLFSQKIRFKDEWGAEFRKWEEKIKLGELIDVISGVPIKGDEITENDSGIRILRGVNITEGYIRHNSRIDRYYNGNNDKIKNCVVKTNDIVLGMDGSKVGKNISLITEKDNGSILIQRVARIRNKPNSDIRFIFQILYSRYFRKYVDIVNTSSGIPHISLKQIKEFKINAPSLPEQKKIAGLLIAIDNKTILIQQLINKTESFKKGLLQQMFV